MKLWHALLVLFTWSTHVHAQDPCADHEGIPIYCDVPTRSRLELPNDFLARYVSAPTPAFPGLPAPKAQACSTSFMANCKPNEVWFLGPNVPLIVNSDVTVKLHFNVPFSCTAAPGSLCSQGWRPGPLARFELLADGMTMAALEISGKDFVLESTDSNIWRYVLTHRRSDRDSAYFLNYLNASVPANAKLSVRITPLTSISQISLSHITITATSL